MNMNVDHMAPEDGLFPAIRPLASNLLRNRYQEPPFTVLDRKGSDWLKRDRKWKALGIQSEVGRDGALTYNMGMDYVRPDGKPIGDAAKTPQTSTFSPTLCELTYRWFSAPGHRVLDPFAGGSVRGIVAGAMGRDYLGIELRPEQVAANRAQADIAGNILPTWVEGDSAAVLPGIVADPGYEADLVFSCPPYTYLEKYSDDPADLSNMPYPDFVDAYRGIIRDAVAALRPNRFAVWVVGEVRSKKTGACLGLPTDTVQAFRDAGADLWNNGIITTPVGTAAVRAPRQFDASRKLATVHEHYFVFVKGDGRKASDAAGLSADGTPAPEDDALGDEGGA